jgi:elongation factor Tu
MTLTDDVRLTPAARRRRWSRNLRVGVALLAVVLPLRLLLELEVLFTAALLGGPLLPMFFAYLLVSIVRGPTSVVVYLRRFGRTQSGRAMTKALEAGVSRRHRIVTLDDSRFPALEAPPWERRLSRYGPPLVAVVLVLAFVVIVRALRQQQDYVMLGITVGAIPVLAASLWSLLTAFLLFVIHRARVRRQARGRVRSEADLVECAADVVRLGAWWRAPGMAAPQATVLSVDDGLWRRAVAMLVRDSDAALIDVSEPTDHLAWEIETVLGEATNRVVFVGDRHPTELWTAAPIAVEPAARDRIRVLLAGRPILTYDASNTAGRRRFRRSLMRALDNVDPARPSRRPVVSAVTLRRRLASFVSAISLYLMAPVLASGLGYVAVKVADPQQAISALFANSHHPLDRLTSPGSELERRGVSSTANAVAEAAREGKTETLSLLVQVGVPHTSAGVTKWTPLLLAAWTGSSDALTTLIAAKANVHDLTDDGRSALMLAAAGGHLSTMQILLEAGAEVNVSALRRTPLGLAIQGGHHEIVRRLLERGADVSTPHLGMPVTVLAAAVGRGDILERVLERGGAANARSETGRTALGVASIAGCVDCVRTLMSKGALVNEVDAFGETALTYAASRGDTALVELLEGAGARQVTAVSVRSNQEGSRKARSTPHMNVAIVGVADGQVPALVSAMTSAFDTGAPRPIFMSAEQIEARRQGLLPRIPKGLDARGMYLDQLYTAERHLALCVPASEHDYRKAAMSSRCHADTVLLLAPPALPDQRFDEAVRFLRWAGVPDIVVIEDKPGNMDERPDASDEAAIRRILAVHGYGNAPILPVSSIGALKRDQKAEASIGELLRVLDGRPLPHHERDAPLLMVVEDAFNVAGKGAVVTVHIENGTVRPGDSVEIVGFEPSKKTVVTRIESFRKLLDMEEAGNNVGVILQGITAGNVQRGQVIARPGTIEAHRRFEAIVYLRSPEEGGRLEPVADGYRPFITMRTAMATATFGFPQPSSELRPGGTAVVYVDLLAPVAMTPGLRFAVHEGPRVVGLGIVTRVM